MFRIIGAALLLIGVGIVGTAPARAADKVDPAADFKAFRSYFTNKFPKVPLTDFVNGPYSMNQDMRKQWQEKEEFPPYDFALDKGKGLFEKPFANGKTFASCFDNGGIGIRQNYPYFDKKSGEVVTLEMAVNQCLQANGEKPFDYKKDDMASITAYMAFTSRGKLFDIKVPDDPRALAAYDKGRQYFFQRRGQLNFSCASCHVQGAGEHIRAEVLAPALGIMAAMPIYRSEWGGMGTITKRFQSCNSQVREKPLPPQDELYRDVEYYLTFMGNGLPVAGPGSRP
jgi:L-cysteine S-thiosulfotransferase